MFEAGHRGIGDGGRVRWMLFHLMSRWAINRSHYMLQREPDLAQIDSCVNNSTYDQNDQAVQFKKAGVEESLCCCGDAALKIVSGLILLLHSIGTVRFQNVLLPSGKCDKWSCCPLTCSFYELHHSAWFKCKNNIGPSFFFIWYEWIKWQWYELLLLYLLKVMIVYTSVQRFGVCKVFDVFEKVSCSPRLHYLVKSTVKAVI